MRRYFVAAIVASSFLGGCATITRGKAEEVSFTSNPSGAKVVTNIGFSCTTPCKTEIARKQPFQAVFTKGKQRKAVNVVTQVQGGGTAAGVGNVIAGGLIGLAVDANSGATLDHVPNPVHVDFP